MPTKKSQRGRGSSRGGRGNRGGRGGRSRGRGRGRSNNNRSRGGYRKSTDSEYNSSAQHQSLFDPDSLWMPTGEMAQAGHNYGRRSYGKFAEEIEYTAQHQSKTLSRRLRDRPMVFVKAKEVYDPNELLYKLSQRRQEDPYHTVIDEEFKGISLDSEEEMESVIEKTISSKGNTLERNELNSVDANVPEEDKKRTESSDESLPCVPRATYSYEDEQEEEGEEESESEIESVLEHLSSDSGSTGEEVRKVPSEIAANEVNTNLLDKNNYPKEGTSYNIESTEDHLSTTERKQTESTTTVYEDDSFQKQEGFTYTSNKDVQNDENIIDAQFTEQPVDSEEDELEIFIDDPQFPETQNVTKQTDTSQNKDSSTPETEQDYGFLPEDYEFDVSKISVANVRFGIQNQYYLKCHELTGFDDEFVWMDEDEVVDYALSNGVKQHRLAKFLSYITSGMIDQEDDNVEEDDDQVYISDDDDDDEDTGSEDEDEFDEDQDDYPYDSDDNLEDLIRYTKSSTQGLVPMQDRDFSNNTPAKNRTSFDNFGLDQEWQDTMLGQVFDFRQNKKAQKQRRKEQQTQDSIESHNLLIKYPDSLTISQIANEFANFIEDTSRTTLSFPTLDSHGNKTLQNMAAAYNMQTDKCGSYNMRHYIKVTKNRKTYKNVPNYNRINAIMRGRPIFHRMDVKREKKSDERKTKRGGGGNESRARFKEGDVVGAEAPELDQSNLGRIMLEKLGWSQGQGLGKANSGINEPIVAKVKMSKTGIR
ncbi:SQS1 [Candida metapsilosis]|uniref:SQS1 n=1 Tax=Candida metapsilosis TaxID=273372 RepID=A0A8H8DDJ8_9ASCO|nr:SQS1 [Candida metapsilosis]